MDRRAPFVVLVIWVAVAPILWGSVAEVGTPGAGWLSEFRSAGGPYAVFRFLGYLTLALLIPSLLGRFGGDRCTRLGTRMLFLMLLLVALATFQLVPLPVGIFRILAPAHARDLGVLLPGQSWAPITTDPGLTGRAVVHLFLLLTAALAVYHTVRTPRRAWILLGTVFGVAAAGAAYGILSTYVGSDRVLGLAKQETGGGVTGTFFYRGNFAAFTAAGLAMAGVAVVRAFRGGRPLGGFASASGLLVLGTGLLLSRSRAGLLAGGVALALGIALSLKNRRLAVTSFGLVILLMVAAGFTVKSLRDRFAHLSGEGSHGYADMRLNAWESSLRLAAGRPVFGAGMGAYRRAIHLTQSENIPEELYYAHSDPLNILAEGGAFALLVVMTIAASGFILALRLARDREDPARGAGVACLAGVTALLLMSLLDFPLQIPATSLVFAVLVFTPVALRAGELPALPGGGVRLFLARFAAAAGFALLLIGVMEDYRRGLDDPGMLTKGEVRHARGRTFLREEKLEEATAELREARRLQPFEGGTRFDLAAVLYPQKDYDAARAEVRAAYLLARGRAELLFRIGWVSLADRSLGDLTVKSFREASSLEERFFPEVIRLPPVTPEMLIEIVPERSASHDLLGRHFDNLGRPEDANRAYLHSVELGARGDVVKRLARTYRKLGREAEGKRELSRLGVDWVE